VETWCKKYPKLVERWRDSDGRPLVHTYFYPAEQYEPEIVERLAEHCHQGWGEIEIHLHHGIGQPDTAENTQRQLVEFRDALSRVHGCLSQVDGSDLPRYAFVHGNFTLANSVPGRACGVDNEMAILAETGCYADFTLPTATFHRAQIAKVNALYECSIPLHHRAPHRQGRDLRYGRPLSVFPIMVQGPLAVVFGRDARSRFVGFENSALTGVNPASLKRLRLWKKAGICVQGKPDWLFVKLHCHGMDPRDTDAMVGDSFRQFLEALVEGAPDRGETLHFVTAREMMNIICAACDGRDGNPGEYRDYRFKRLRSRSGESRPARGSQVLLKG
jgi:hypothetical protein